MNVATARNQAWEWVHTHASSSPDFRGAYFTGSTISLPDDAELPSSSDVDIIIVTTEAAPVKLGKFRYADTLLEVTELDWKQIATPEQVLASYHLAGSFRQDTIIMDPTGHLQFLLNEVAPRFAERTWVLRRCEEARMRVENGLRSIKPDAPLHERVMSWLFPGGVTTHMLLVAALRNPTIRLRYLAAREVLQQYGQLELYPELMKLLGCQHWTAEQAEGHLHALAETFDAAAAVSRTPFFFGSDISPESRSIAIDGSRKLIRSGNHRDAVFWMVATFARCHYIFAADAPDLGQQWLPAFQAILQDLGLTSPNDLNERVEAILNFVPEVWDAALKIMDANPQLINR